MKGAIYFVQIVTGPIKIGFTTNLEGRLEALRTASPGGLTLLTTICGTLGAESYLHHMFAKDRISGEWFTPTTALLDVIEQAQQYGNICVPKEFRAESIEKTIRSPRDEEIDERVQWYLFRLAEPIPAGDSVRKQIDRVMARLGFSYGRTRDLWYKRARLISASEYLTIRELYDAMVIATYSPSRDLAPELIEIEQ